MPDSEIFDTVEFDYNVLNQRIRELAYLNKGLELIFTNEKTGETNKYKFEGGIKSYVKSPEQE